MLLPFVKDGDGYNDGDPSRLHVEPPLAELVDLSGFDLENEKSSPKSTLDNNEEQSAYLDTSWW